MPGLIIGTLVYCVLVSISIVMLVQEIQHIRKRVRYLEAELTRLSGRGHSGPNYGNDKDYI